MQTLFWIDFAGLCISLLVASSLTFTVVGVNPRSHVNRAFGFLTGAMALWTASALLLRLSLWLEPVMPRALILPNTHLWLSLASISLSLMCVFSLAFSAAFLNRRTRWTDLATAFGLAVITVAFISSLITPWSVVAHVSLDENDLVVHEISKSAKLAFGMLNLFIVWSVILFWQERPRTGATYLALSLVVLLLGLMFRSFVYAPFPILSFSNAVSALILAYGVISRQIFNPLRERTFELRKEIEERKQVQEALKDYQQTISAIVETSQDWIWAIDHNGTHTYSNQAVRSILGISAEEIVGNRLQHLLHPEDREMVGARWPEWVERKSGWRNVILRWRHKDGDYRFLESNSVPFLDPERRLLGFRGVDRDITERIRAEQALSESEGKFRSLVEATSDWIWETDVKGNYTYASPRIRDLLGYEPHEVIGRTPFDFMPPEEVDRLVPEFASISAKGQPFFNLENVNLRKDGRRVTLETSGVPRLDPQGKPLGYRGIDRDITERKAWEQRLESKTRELEVLNSLGRQMGADLSMESAVKTALNHTVRSVHPDAALILLRQGERLVLKGLEPGDFLEPGAQMAIHRLGECLCGLAVREGKAIFSRDIHTDPRCIYEECKKADLCSFAAMPLRSAGEVIGILGVGSRPQRDFEEQAPFLEALTNEIAIGLKNAMLYEEAQTDAIELQTRLTQIQMAEREKQDLTKQLYQAQKMEAIGTLAGGIAHDFNNILAPIIIGAELALTTTPVDNQAHPMLQKVLSAGIRAKDLVQQILTFSRQSDVETSPLRLQPIIKETIKLARASLPATIEIRQDIRAENDLVLANPTQMHQVMMNLIANAGHAMRPKGGILEMTLNNMHLDDAAVAGLPEITAGHYVLLTVRDTGHGMERRTMEQIFNPFFTTKERGEGTGLGLSIVHGIVRGYGGAITVESQPGVGTTFTLYLPVTKTEVVEKTKAADPLPQGTESIMLVDDEPVIAEVYSQMLEQLGYKLDARTDPRDALAAFRSDPKAYDLVITDMTMPRMTGDKLAAELLRIRPDIPVILCTGFSEQITEQKALDMGIRDFIMKPIVTSNIAQKIRKALDREKAGEESNMSGEKAGL